MNKAHNKVFNDQRGFTLIELLVVMAVFLIVIIIANNAFLTILSNSSSLTKSAESNIEGVIGLEVFRHDLEQTGFGLPWSFPGSINYAEAGAAPKSSYNEPGGNVVPRAIIADDNITTANLLAKPDYLVLKGTTLGLNENSQRWTHVEYNQNPRQWDSDSDNLIDGQYFIALRKTFTESGVVNELVLNSGSFSGAYSSTAMPTGFKPNLQEDIYFIYGISKDAPQMPFNRADYYLEQPAIVPKSCAPHTGTLYKSAINQDGTSTPVPLLDCVADMQIVLGWDFDGDGVIDTYSSPNATSYSSSKGFAQKNITDALNDPASLRSQLRVIKVYILAQDGLISRSYHNTQGIVVGGQDESTLTSSYTVAQIANNGWDNYRWRVYRLIITPKNLVQPSQ